MKKGIAAAAIAATVGLTGTSASGQTFAFSQGFESNADGWLAFNSPVTRVASSSNGVPSADGSFHGFIDTDHANYTGAFTRLGGYRTSFGNGFTASAKVYLDTSWAVGSGFDYSVAANRQNNSHLRDFIFHVGVQSDGTLRVGGSNNSNFATRNDLANINNAVISSTGWYEFRHVFYDDGGSLSVDLQLLDGSGNILLTETRSNAADTIADIVGGNRYGWFTHVTIDDDGDGVFKDGLNIDTVTLVIPLPGAAGMALAGMGMIGLRRRR